MNQAGQGDLFDMVNDAPVEIVQEVARLRREIETHNRHYYVDAQPVISDREFDALMARLLEGPTNADPSRGTGIPFALADYRRLFAALPEAIHTQRAHAMAEDGTHPTQCGRMPVEYTHKRACMRHLLEQAFNMRLADFVMRLLAKSPEDRFPSARYALAALRSAATPH